MATLQQQKAVQRRITRAAAEPNRPDEALAIVGIGVSADSIEALQELLAAMPADAGLAYVVIQHAAPPRQSLCAHSLGSAGTRVFVDVEDGTVPQANQVYIAPADEEYTVQDGVLRRETQRRHERPFDRFLLSLAQDRKMLARGVVLSGSGLDSADGLLAIRAHGGLSFAQDPTTARYGGMPNHAIAAQAVDFVLSPRRIAEELVARSPHDEAHGRGARCKQLDELRRELRNAQARQQAMVERHIASYEELTAANEELHAANEELHAMNDELQASRQQMHVVTEELQQRNTALDAANDDLMNVLASVEIPMLIVDAERRVRRYLPAAAGLVNLLPHDVGRPIRELQAKVDTQCLDQWIAQVIETAKPADFEVRDAEGRWRRLQIRPYHSRGKHNDGALVSLIDIDALKHLIDESNAARDRAGVVFETVPAPIVVLDEALRLESANRSFYQFFELEREHVARCAFLELDRPRNREALRAQLERTLAGGGAFHAFEVQYFPPSRPPRLVSLDGCRIRSEQGRHSLLLVLQDETERRRHEEEHTRARAERVQRFLNEAGRMLLCESVESDSALEKLARMAVPALGEVCLIDIVGEDGKIAPAALASKCPEAGAKWLDAALERDGGGLVADVVRTGRSTLEVQLDDAALARIDGPRAELLRSCGARSYLCVALKGRGAVLGALSLASSRPERHYGADDVALAEGLGQRAGMAMETALQYRAAHEAVQLRDDFLAIASHELRTPLTALSLQLENLHALLPAAAHAGEGRSGLGDKVGHALRYTRRLGRLIDSLLVVSRIMAGHFTLQLEDVDLSQIAREVVERMRTDAARARCTLELRAPGEVCGHWDAMRLDQIVSNLLTNAFRYAAGTHVRVSVGANDHRATLSVEDAGPGIARERVPLIFERYEIAGERTTSGLGLGLYIIRQIAEAHGGRVRVETELGHGARFVVELPTSRRES